MSRLQRVFLLLCGPLLPACTGQSSSPPNPTGMIAFISDRDGIPGIYTMMPDGSEQEALTKNTPAMFPKWSPKGWPLAFTFIDPNKRFRIELVAPVVHKVGVISGGKDNPKLEYYLSFPFESRRVTQPADDCFMTAWSPDGAKLAFVSGRDGPNHIYMMNADGSDQRRVSPIAGEWPTWSPDGTSIAFASKDVPPSIYTMAVDGSGLIRLTKDRPASCPAWSPDGKRIAFAAEGDGKKVAIYLMNPDGTGLAAITDHATDNNFPAWSPDGRHIAFGSQRDGNKEIYVMNADGSGQKRLTNHPAMDALPTWGPVERFRKSPPPP